ncbi:MAG TPA: glycosyltransferase family 4 protein [Gaiellaceae bacterium]|nr:glycosyltransferase family 4 protein [Gaiellaceae bacterium]
MRIAEIAPPWIEVPPEGYGGIELVVDLLTTGLHARGHDVTLFAPEGSLSDADVVSPLPAAGVSSIGDPWFEAYHVLVAYREVEQFDLVHDHTFLGPALAATLRDGPPVVHTLHGPWEGRARSYYQLLHDQIHLVAISAAQRSANSSVHYAGTIPNGIDVDSYPMGEGRREDFLVYIGRSNADKAPELAVELAHRANLPLKLVVKCSEDAEREHWEREVEPRLNGSEEVLAEVSHDEKVDLLQRGRAFVFPIRWEEPFGLVMVEAMACGMPVLATRRGAARDLVVDGETGFLRDDLDELVAMTAAVDDIRPETCRAHVERHFSAHAMATAYEELFERVRMGGRGDGDAAE